MSHERNARSRRVHVFGLLAVAALVLGLTSAGSPAGAAQGGPKPKSGGQLIWSLSSEPANLDPGGVAGAGVGAATAGPYFQAVYDSLANFETATAKVVPRLATKFEADSSGLVWTVTLRTGVQFSDGTPFDATAVKAHWDRLADPASGTQIRSTIAGWTWEVEDPQTIVVTLDGPRSNFPNLLAGQLGAIPSPAAVTRYGSSFGSGPDTTVGAGPCILEEWVRNDHMTLTKNPTYWDEGKPYLDTLEFKTILDPAIKADALRTKTIDIAFISGADATTEALESEGYDELATSIPLAYGAIFNVSRPPFDDVRVRKAFVLATDAPDINLKATGNASPLASGKPGIAWYPKGSPYYDKSVKQDGPNYKKAQKLIDEYVAANGPIDTTLVIPANVSSTGDALAQSWNKLDDVDVKTDTQTSTIVIQRYQTGDFAAGVTTTPGFLAVDEAVNGLETGGSANVIHYSNPEMDKVLAEGVQYSDSARRKEYLNKIAQILLDDAVYSRVYYVVQIIFSSPDAGGLATEQGGVTGYPSVYTLFRNGA